MYKSKSRGELIAIEADREIAGWNPQNADFMGLVLKDIERVPLDAESDDDCRVVNELIAYLEGELDIVLVGNLCGLWAFDTMNSVWDAYIAGIVFADNRVR